MYAHFFVMLLYLVCGFKSDSAHWQKANLAAHPLLVDDVVADVVPGAEDLRVVCEVL